VTPPERVHRVDIPGIPIPQGSKKGYAAGGHVNIVDDNADVLKPWRAEVSTVLRSHRNRHRIETYLGPVSMRLDFRFPLLKSDKDEGPYWKDTKPDIDKLERAILDAGTTAGVYKDDGQVVRVFKRKVRDTVPGVTIEWWEEP